MTPDELERRGARANAALVAVAMKARVTVLDRKGFERVIAGLTVALSDAAAGPERDAAAAGLAALDQDWPNLTDAERSAALRKLEGALVTAARPVGRAVSDVLEERGGAIAHDARKVAVGRYKLPVGPSLDLVDVRVLEHAATSQAFFVTNEVGARASAASALARDVVASGLERGFDHNLIGKELRARVGPMLAGRSANYWGTVASIFAGRARAMGVLTGFEEAGIARATWSSVLDQVTCLACRFMHGQTFSVGAALGSFRAVAESEDPEDVRELQPFLGVGKDEDGREAIFARRPSGIVPLAVVTESAFGKLDERGSFKPARGGADLDALGVGSPPSHPRCRCTLIPVF